MRIFFIWFFLMILTGCSSSKYSENPNKYLELLGTSTQSKSFEAFVNQLEVKEIPEITDQFWNEEFPKLDFYDQSLMLPQNGIEMLLKNKKIVSPRSRCFICKL